MKDGGIEELLTESGVFKSGKANKVIAGRDYYKMVRCHTLVCEAMLVGLAWDAFEEWTLTEGRHDLDFGDSLDDLYESLLNKDPASALNSCTDVKATLEEIISIWKEFIDSLGVTAKYWLMYVDMVSILKRFIKAERAGKWMEHLAAIQHMLPYIVAAKHTNYMSCLPLYLKEMRDLEEKHPAVYNNFIRGRFTVHRTEGRFNGVWTDMALEQTYNKEGKTSLVKGISQNPGAREKYIKSAPFLSHVSESVKAMAQLENKRTSSHHHGASCSQAREEQTLVETIRKVVTEKMVNPFTTTNHSDLLNIASGEKAPSNDLIATRELGLEAMEKAEEDNSNKLVPPKLITFSTKKSAASKAQTLVKIYQDESSVSRALCFFQSSEEHTREAAFSHEWTAYPSSLFEVDPRVEQDYAMRKGAKSDYLTALMSLVTPEVSQPSSLPASNLRSVFLVDAMAFVNRFQYLGAKTFADITQRYVMRILSLMPSNCTFVNVVGDRYDIGEDKSLKGDERQRRNQSEQSREFHPSNAVPVPDFKMLMKNPRNKANLLEFVTESLCVDKQMIPENVTFILGGTSRESGRTVVISNATVSTLDELSCSLHEEADTRIMAHLWYSVEQLGCTRAVVHATDTDILIFCMYYYCCLVSLQELWVQTKPDRFLPIHELVASLSGKYMKHHEELTATLLCVYVLSGCDTVSYPFRRGKKKAAAVAIDMVGRLPNLAAYGSSEDFTVTEEIKTEATLLFTALYGKRGHDCSLNTLRQHVFASTKSDLRMLPPTDDAFNLHLLRALYQLALYQTPHLSNPALPPATEFGRVLINGRLCPLLMTIPAKPNIQQPVSCKCKKSKCLRSCSCTRAGVLKGTHMWQSNC